MHSILKMPQTQSLKPLEKFLGDQQVSPLHSTGDSPGWLMTHPASASLDTGGEMNKCIKPWVSRRRALGQTKARLEISVLQHKENGNESVRLCMAKRESKNGTRWETQAKRQSSCQVTACSLMHTRTFIWRVGGHESITSLKLPERSGTSANCRLDRLSFFQETPANGLNNLQHKFIQAYECEAQCGLLFMSKALKITWHCHCLRLIMMGTKKKLTVLNKKLQYFCAKRLQTLVKPDWRACATPGGSKGMALLFLAVISDCVKWDDIKSTHPDSQSGTTSYIKGATIPTSSWALWRSVCPYSPLSGEAGRPGIKSPEILTRVAWAVSSCHDQPLVVQMRWNYSWDEGGIRDKKEIRRNERAQSLDLLRASKWESHNKITDRLMHFVLAKMARFFSIYN